MKALSVGRMCVVVLVHNYGLFVAATFVDKTGNVRIIQHIRRVRVTTVTVEKK